MAIVIFILRVLIKQVAKQVQQFDIQYTATRLFYQKEKVK